jgi:hypothetical protein
MKKQTKTKKRNPNDATMRNIRALRKDLNKELASVNAKLHQIMIALKLVPEVRAMNER